MSASLRALLTGVIDYAGMFPPASLPLEEAIRNYARYRQEPESWMLGRFVCPAGRLVELAPFVEELFSSRPPLPLAVLGRKAKNMLDLDISGEDVADMVFFQQSQESRASFDAYEIRFPTDFGSYPPFAVESVNSLLLETMLYANVFCEASPESDRHASFASMLSVLAGCKGKKPLGFKLRCGGSDAVDLPSPEEVAYVIASCSDAGIRLKFTAGLHHPIRHFNAEVQTKMHGFINVFTAGVLAHARRLSAEKLRPIIEDEDAGHFQFDDNGLSWKEWSATTEEIAAARKQVVSFGSCSFDEPREDLRRLGWLA